MDDLHTLGVIALDLNGFRESGPLATEASPTDRAQWLSSSFEPNCSWTGRTGFKDSALQGHEEALNSEKIGSWGLWVYEENPQP